MNKKIHKSFDSLSSLAIYTVIGLIIAGIIVFCNFFTNGENLLFSNLSQGEVLVGIVIGVPTLITWRKKEKKYISENALSITKYYNEQLDEVANEINNSKELSMQRALKIKYIVETFNTLFNEWDIQEKTKISLNFFHVLPTITSIKYPDSIEGISSQAKYWKESLSVALEPILKELIKIKEIKEKFEILESEDVKYFSLINFETEKIYFEKINFKGKFFVECTFSKEFLNNNIFQNCKFINCTFGIDKNDEKYKTLVEAENTIIGDNTEFNSFNENFNNISKKLNNLYVNNIMIKDARDNIVINSYIVNNKYYEYEIEDISYNKVKELLFDKIKNIDSDINKNNSIISISKNYIDNSNKNEYEENSLYMGWHSLFKDRFEKENKDYYIFGVKDINNCYTIIFKYNELKNYLKNKTIDKSGKYNFYFNAIRIDNANEVNNKLN